MTTENLPEQARAEAERRYSADTTLSRMRREAFIGGVEWAADHLALDRDTIARTINGAVPADVPGFRYRYAERAADAVLAASPLRTVTDAKAEAWEEGWAAGRHDFTMAQLRAITTYIGTRPERATTPNPYRAARLAGGDDRG